MLLQVLQHQQHLLFLTFHFNGPISEVRVARVNGEFLINPILRELANADLDIMVGATYDNIMMVEGEMKEVAEEVMLEALRIAHEAIKVQCIAQKELAELVGKTEKREYCHEVNDEDLRKKIWDETYTKCYAVASAGSDKKTRTEGFENILKEFLAQYTEENPVNEMLVARYYHDVEKEAARGLFLMNTGDLMVANWMRFVPSGVRLILCLLLMAQLSLPVVRHSHLLQLLLEPNSIEKMIDEVLRQGSEKFVLHYNFPPFATGEAKAARSTSRREIGHGNLAHRALKNMMPPDETNPYAIRVVSDILESNGSSSMATVCAGTLALMDAGVQIKETCFRYCNGSYLLKRAEKNSQFFQIFLVMKTTLVIWILK